MQRSVRVFAKMTVKSKSHSARWLRIIRLSSRRGPSIVMLVCFTGMAALLSFASFEAMGATPALASFGLNAAAAVGLAYVATRLGAARRRLAAAEQKLGVAEARSERIVNFNSADFEDKAPLIEMTLNHMN